MTNFLSHNLSYLMKKDKLSCNDVSKSTKIPIATIQKIRSGDIANPTIETLVPISEYFKISIDNLIKTKYSDENLLYKYENSIPLISMNDADNFPNCQILRYISIDYINKQDVYSFEILDGGIVFDKGSILVVDKKLTPKNQDNVVVKHLTSGKISVKKVFFDDEYYLSSVTKGIENKIFNSQDYLINGVVVCCIKFF